MSSEEQIRQCAQSLVGVIKDTEEQIEHLKGWLMRYPNSTLDDPFSRNRWWSHQPPTLKTSQLGSLVTGNSRSGD